MINVPVIIPEKTEHFPGIALDPGIKYEIQVNN